MDSPAAETSAEPTAITAPDWTTITLDVLCPLCEYNLRGLQTPRCPECGHQFDWIDVLDPNRAVHPWLFEHQSRRRVRSLARTFVASLIPAYFWKSVKTTHKPVARRLVVYWIVSTLLCAIPVTFPIADIYWRTYQARHAYLTQILRRQKDPSVARAIQFYGSPAAMADQSRPYPPVWELMTNWREIGSPTLETASGLVVAVALWPWLTMLTMMIFQQSMRRASIKIAHVFRCVVYAFGMAMLLVMPVAWLLNQRDAIERLIYERRYIPQIDWISLSIFLLAVAALTHRLAMAYRLYLRFPHAVATSIASQLIVMLTMLAIASFS